MKAVCAVILSIEDQGAVPFGGRVTLSAEHGEICIVLGSDSFAVAFDLVRSLHGTSVYEIVESLTFAPVKFHNLEPAAI